MDDITVSGLTKWYRGKTDAAAVDDISFTVDAGEMLALVGSSGCGKTTTLRCLAGLESPETGSISFGSNVVVDTERRVFVPPQRRDIGLVFQSYALWPHLTAQRNIEFPLRARRVARAERRARVEHVANMVELDASLLAKHPGHLSGGQQQRVALARALVPRTGVVLFDEPLSNLDARLREQLRGEITDLHSKIGFTGVYVTHDLTEALVLGSRVAVMQAGRIVQVGAPEDVFERPAATYVARMVGMRPLTTSTWAPLGWHSDDGRIAGTFDACVPAGSTCVELWAQPASLSVRPADAPLPRDHVRIEGGVLERDSYLGPIREVAVRLGRRTVRALVSDGRLGIEPGTTVAVDVHVGSLRAFPHDDPVDASASTAQLASGPVQAADDPPEAPPTHHRPREKAARPLHA